MKQRGTAVSFDFSALNDIERDGKIPAEMLVPFLELLAKRGPEKMTRETATRLFNNGKKARSLAVRIEKLSHKAREFANADPFAGVQTPVYKLDDSPAVAPRSWQVGSASQVGRAIDGMDFLAKSMREASRFFGDYRRSYGRKVEGIISPADRGIDFVVGWILIQNRKFHSWEALARLLAQAFIAAGVDEKKTARITEDMLRGVVKRRVLAVIKGE